MGPLLGVKGLQTPVTGTSNNPKATPPSSEDNEGVCSLALVKTPNSNSEPHPIPATVLCNRQASPVVNSIASLSCGQLLPHLRMGRLRLRDAQG